MTTDVSAANAEQTTDAESSSTAAVEPVMSAATAGNYRIQVGAFRDKNTAVSTWTNLSNQYPSVFGGYDAITEPANLGVEQGTWYRLQVVSFESKAQAAVFCDRYKLAQQGAACFPVLAP
jgi:cell division protein FtsN